MVETWRQRMTFQVKVSAHFCGLPGWLSGKESACQCRRLRFDHWAGKIPRKRAWQPTPVFLPGESHGQRSLVGYRWGHKESDTTEHVCPCLHLWEIRCVGMRLIRGRTKLWIWRWSAQTHGSVTMGMVNASLFPERL